ncbi:hypothetical protein RND71_030138 [Anisodus tanguticus]|uniref:Uncharacterized protein n=1 Tax=Anisodus tanguticus TaxID=243964 RepID=A0AAE1RER1_9SOLA|nr:hypothetical protein RND71_030138 [Anisodus tanguticus]
MSSRGASEPLAVGRVIGEVVDSFIASVKMKAIYNGSKQVSNGRELMPAVVAAQPRVKIGGEDMRSAYTLTQMLQVPVIHTILEGTPPLLSGLRQTISGDSSPGPSALLPVNRRMCLNDQDLRTEQLISHTRSYSRREQIAPTRIRTHAAGLQLDFKFSSFVIQLCPGDTSWCY